MKFGFDIDDTLINLREHAFHIYNKKLNRDVGINVFKNIQRVEIHEAFDMSEEQGKEMWNNSLEEIYYTYCPPFPGAVETLQTLEEKGHEIYYITARPKEHGERSKEWLKQRGFPVNDKRFFYGMRDEEKLYTIQKLQLDYYVDDKPTVLHTLADSSIKLYVKDQAYNRDMKDIPRIVEWTDFINEIL
ncbi:5' nucleotidase, NT5C type [Oceanobacillus damuensis]|uniref:5' nucleotidase, NT5C type n=1 Tax=Oceanobacillus damuensis TaxID=937928 RepID=UPI00082AB7E5|nr:HAD family acid phosphatase [Oceanobacillus damuensis]